MENAKKMLIMRHGFKSITFSAYKERLLKLFRMAVDRSQLVDGRWYNQQIQYTQNDVSIIIISSRITVMKIASRMLVRGLMPSSSLIFLTRAATVFLWR